MLLETHSLPLIRKLSRMLHDVPRRPTPEPVHRLRTTIRRLEAVLDAMPEGNHDKLRKLLRDLRRSAGRVRNLDVQIALLKTVKPDGHPEQKEIVMRALTAKRSKREKKLLATLEAENVAAIRKRLNKLGLEVRKPEPERQAPAIANPVGVGLDQFYEAAQRVDKLTRETMHDFRTECKRVRYLAEMGRGEPNQENVVRELKRIQDAVGTWHDWAQLEEFAADALEETPHAVLLGILKTTVQTHFAQALRTIEQSRDTLNAIRGSRRKRAGKVVRSTRPRTAIAG